MSDKTFMVEVSARHVHLDRKAMDALFGEGSELHQLRELSQPGEFLCEERVDVIGPKREIKNVAVLGPLRAYTQCEVTVTDGFSIGIAVPVRESGVLEGTPAFTLRGPKGEYQVPFGAIAAKRHVHMRPEDAENLGVSDKEIVSVKIDTDGRSLTFGDVVVRVSPKFGLAMHIDTDEANAAGVPRDGTKGCIVK